VTAARVAVLLSVAKPRFDHLRLHLHSRRRVFV
jgi:hypothetical protein